MRWAAPAYERAVAEGDGERIDRFIINTWLDEGIRKKGPVVTRRGPVMEGSYLRTVRTVGRLGMYPSAPTDFAFCIDKALVHAPFRSQDSVILSMHPFSFFLTYVPFWPFSLIHAFLRGGRRSSPR